MKKLLLISALALAGCSSLQYAGNASYSIKPFVTDTKTGTAACCQVDIHDGKERAALDVRVIKNGENYDITFSERSVQAFAGQAIAANALQAAIDQAAKTAAAAILLPILPGLVPIVTSGATGAVVGGAAIGIGGSKLLSAPAPATTPVTPTESLILDTQPSGPTK
jgi:hypothetical protein